MRYPGNAYDCERKIQRSNPNKFNMDISLPLVTRSRNGATQVGTEGLCYVA